MSRSEAMAQRCVSGIEAARGRYVIMADADDSYALDDLGPFVAELRNGSDLVMGNRFKGGIAPGAMPPLHRYIGNPVLSWLGRRFFHVSIGDFHCGMRGFDRDKILALGLRTSGMEFASEMVVRASLNHLRITEVPTTLKPDGRSRSPHLRTWSDGWRHLRFLHGVQPALVLPLPSARSHSPRPHRNRASACRSHPDRQGRLRCADHARVGDIVDHRNSDRRAGARQPCLRSASRPVARAAPGSIDYWIASRSNAES